MTKAQLALTILQGIGLCAYAAAGALSARRKGLDLVGAIVIAFFTAFGGGSLRDLLLGRTPVFWVTHTSNATMVLVASALTFYLVKPNIHKGSEDTHVATEAFDKHLARRATVSRIIMVLDALGLGVFGVSGAAYSLQAGTSYLIAALMAVITGVFGGVLRDVILNEIPGVFQQRTEWYATCAFIGAWAYLLLRGAGVPDAIAFLAGAIAIFGLRLLAVVFHWRLPQPGR